jgi:hypothetical protein
MRRRALDIGTSAPVASVLRRRSKSSDVSCLGDEVVPMVTEKDYIIGMLGKVRGEVDGDRNSGLLHISSLLTGCVRRIALAERFKVAPQPTMVQPSLGLVFAQGNAIHDYIKKQFCIGYKDNMYGEWACLCGKLRTAPMVLRDIPQKKCSHCNTVPSEYAELKLEDEDHGVVGSPDIILYHRGKGFLYPVEVKSIESEAFKALVRPKPDHILQLTFYWYLLRRRGHKVANKSSILYVTKGFNYKQPYKEFMISPVDEVERLLPYLEESASLVAARAGGDIPPRKQCSSIDCTTAKSCPVATICFSLK